MTMVDFDFCKERRKIMLQMAERGWSHTTFELFYTLKQEKRNVEKKNKAVSLETTRKRKFDDTMDQENGQDILQRKRQMMYREMAFNKEEQYLLQVAAKKAKGGRKHVKSMVEKKPISKFFTAINFNLTNPRSQ